jgi:hypothetical protein
MKARWFVLAATITALSCSSSDPDDPAGTACQGLDEAQCGAADCQSMTGAPFMVDGAAGGGGAASGAGCEGHGFVACVPQGVAGAPAFSCVCHGGYGCYVIYGGVSQEMRDSGWGETSCPSPLSACF